MVLPKLTMLLIDEMAHVTDKAAEPASGPVLAGHTRWVKEPTGANVTGPVVPEG